MSDNCICPVHIKFPKHVCPCRDRAKAQADEKKQTAIACAKLVCPQCAAGDTPYSAMGGEIRHTYAPCLAWSIYAMFGLL